MLVALRAWYPTWSSQRIHLTVSTDNMATLAMCAKMQPQSAHMSIIAREMALIQAEQEEEAAAARLQQEKREQEQAQQQVALAAAEAGATEESTAVAAAEAEAAAKQARWQEEWKAAYQLHDRANESVLCVVCCHQHSDIGLAASL